MAVAVDPAVEDGWASDEVDVLSCKLGPVQRGAVGADYGVIDDLLSGFDICWKVEGWC